MDSGDSSICVIGHRFDLVSHSRRQASQNKWSDGVTTGFSTTIWHIGHRSEGEMLSGLANTSNSKPIVADYTSLNFSPPADYKWTMLPPITDIADKYPVYPGRVSLFSSIIFLTTTTSSLRSSQQCPAVAGVVYTPSARKPCLRGGTFVLARNWTIQALIAKILMNTTSSRK
jgi:hypothetical protein